MKEQKRMASVLTFYVARWIAVNPAVKEHFKMAKNVADFKRFFYNRCKNYITDKEAFSLGAYSIDWERLYQLIEEIK